MPGQRFSFGPFLLNPDNGMLLRRGEPVVAGRRAIRLLEVLVAHPGEVISKADLIDAAWPGTAVEESNLSVQIAGLRKLLGASADGGEWIATVPRVGYRFLGDVDTTRSAPPSPDAIPMKRPRREPSIAVLPFANLSDDPAQEHFADGLSEDIITTLSSLRWLFVAARNSCFAWKGKRVGAEQVGRDLGVRYILSGSVRRFADRVRVTAQLTDASASAQVWAEKYDRELVDFFSVQDQITESVVAAIEPYLFAAEGFRPSRKAPGSLEAWGCVVRAMPHIWTWAADDNQTAAVYLSQAIAIDPTYARANALLAWVYAQRLNIGWAPLEEAREKAAALAERAVDQDGDDHWARLALGYIHSMSRRFEAAVEELARSLSLNPSFAFAHAMLGMAYGYAGEPDLGLERLAVALRLSPRDPYNAGYLSAIGLCHFMAGRYAEAADFQRRCVALRPHFASGWRTLAAAAGLCGEIDAAVHALAEAKRLQPELSIEWVEKHHPIVREADRAIYIEGLRKAGLG